MKKKRILFLSILFLIFLVLGMNFVFSSGNNIKISNVVLNQKNKTAESEILEFNDENVKMETVFHKLDDYVVYKVTIQNTDSKDYIIKSITDNNNNTYIDYEYSDYSNLELKADEDLKKAKKYCDNYICECLDFHNNNLS